MYDSSIQKPKEDDGPLELELQAILSPFMGTGTEMGSHARAAGTLNGWAISPAPLFDSLYNQFFNFLKFIFLES